jgi:hypothetical protein
VNQDYGALITDQPCRRAGSDERTFLLLTALFVCHRELHFVATQSVMNKLCETGVNGKMPSLLQ